MSCSYFNFRTQKKSNTDKIDKGISIQNSSSISCNSKKTKVVIMSINKDILKRIILPTFFCKISKYDDTNAIIQRKITTIVPNTAKKSSRNIDVIVKYREITSILK